MSRHIKTNYTKISIYALISLFLLPACTLPPVSDNPGNIPTHTTPMNVNQFYSKVSDPWMIDLIKCANRVMTDPDFLVEVDKIQKFDYSSDIGQDVTKFIMASPPKEVKMYSSKLPWSKTIAYTYPYEPVIYLNRRKNPRDIFEMTNTLCHEALHVAINKKYYKHGNNYSAGKEKSPSYFVGDIAEKHARVLCQ